MNKECVTFLLPFLELPALAYRISSNNSWGRLFLFLAQKEGDYSKEANILSILVEGGDYSREAINHGTVIIWGNTLLEHQK